MNRYTLKFQNKKHEKRYRRLVVLTNLNFIRFAYYLLLAIFSGYMIGEAVINEDARLWIVRVAFIGAFFVAGFILCTKYVHRKYNLVAFGVIT